jgi:hypothetical protein
MKEVPGEANSETHISVISNLGRLSLYQLLPSPAGNTNFVSTLRP